MSYSSLYSDTPFSYIPQRFVAPPIPSPIYLPYICPTPALQTNTPTHPPTHLKTDVERLSDTSKHGLMDFHEHVAGKYQDPPARTARESLDRITRCTTEAARHVTRPLLCLMADDDDVCPPFTCKAVNATAATSSGIVVARTEKGGHCGWFEGARGKSWCGRVAVEFLVAALADAHTQQTTQPAQPSLTQTQ